MVIYAPKPHALAHNMFNRCCTWAPATAAALLSTMEWRQPVNAARARGGPIEYKRPSSMCPTSLSRDGPEHRQPHELVGPHWHSNIKAIHWHSNIKAIHWHSNIKAVHWQ